MKKFISLLLVFLLTFSLCACGSVEIGPLTFNFDRIPSEPPVHDWSGDTSVAVDAPAAEMPAVEEIAPVEADFEIEFHSMFYGEFAENGTPAFASSTGSAPYLIVSFTFRDIYDCYSDIYVDRFEIGGTAYPMVNPYDNEKHFVNNIDRYFGYEYAFEYAEVRNNEVKAFACFNIDNQAMVMLDSGEQGYIYLCGTEIPVAPMYAEMIDDMLFGETYYGYTFEGAHSGATFLWSLDLSHQLLDGILSKTEQYGDTGVYDDFSESEHLSFLYNTGTAFSPAVTPILETGFSYGYAPVPFDLGFAAEKYPDIVDIAYEYADICIKVAELSYGEGNYSEVIELINYAHELYFMMASLLADAYGVYLWYF